MKEQQSVNFKRIAQAIEYIEKNFRNQPDLEEVAEEVHLSPFYFQRLFTEWAGVSPKKFLQYISVEYAKRLLRGRELSLFDTACETGLSGTARLHDLFVNIEGMTPGEYKNGGEHLAVNYSFSDTLFGKVIVASTMKGVCYMAFAEEEGTALGELRSLFPNAVYRLQVDLFQKQVLAVFERDWNHLDQIKLHLKGTDFQLKVWETLLKIPMGQLTTYGTLAKRLDKPKASRAVGSAVGANPVAFLIPCHRVIQSGGTIGGYHWGTVRKLAMIGWEAARTSKEI